MITHLLVDGILGSWLQHSDSERKYIRTKTTVTGNHLFDVIEIQACEVVRVGVTGLEMVSDGACVPSP